MLVNVRSQSPLLWEILHFADPLNVSSQSAHLCGNSDPGVTTYPECGVRPVLCETLPREDKP